MLASGLSIDIVDSEGQTPLHWALQYNSKLYLSHHIIVIIIYMTCVDNLECIQLLMSEGGDPNAMNDNGLIGRPLYSRDYTYYNHTISGRSSYRS